jgi:hypothetical protein
LGFQSNGAKKESLAALLSAGFVEKPDYISLASLARTAASSSAVR